MKLSYQFWDSVDHDVARALERERAENETRFARIRTHIFSGINMTDILAFLT